ncbi:MAG: preprotein translocase subunit SecG [Bacteroidota bacterium]|jgi:preprotein translocase subunit SecG
MTLLFVILIILASVILGLIVLIQNPKGGGLSGNIAGFSNQFMGVKQTTDVLEKGTWIFGGLIAVLCIVSVVFMPKNVSTGVEDRLNQATGTGIPAPKPATQPATQPPAAVPAPTPATPAPGGK